MSSTDSTTQDSGRDGARRWNRWASILGTAIIVLAASGVSLRLIPRRPTPKPAPPPATIGVNLTTGSFEEPLDFRGKNGIRLSDRALNLTPMPPAPSSAENEWIGKRVVPKSSQVGRFTGGSTVGRETPILIYRVESAEADLLRLKAEGGGQNGWAKVEEVVLVDQAIEFFTARIRDNPKDGSRSSCGRGCHRSRRLRSRAR